MTKPELQKQLRQTEQLLNKLLDRQARGDKTCRVSIRHCHATMRYLKRRIQEES